MSEYSGIYVQGCWWKVVFFLFSATTHPPYDNGIKNIMEDQYPLIYLSIILKSYFARKRRLADGGTKRKLADTLT